MKSRKVNNPHLQVTTSTANIKCFVSIETAMDSRTKTVGFVDIIEDVVDSHRYQYRQGNKKNERKCFQGKFDNLKNYNSFFVELETKEELTLLISTMTPRSFEIITQYKDEFSELLFGFSATNVGSDLMMSYFSSELSDILLFESCYINHIADVLHKLYFWEDVVEGVEITRPLVKGHQWRDNSPEKMKEFYIKESKEKILGILNASF